MSIDLDLIRLRKERVEKKLNWLEQLRRHFTAQVRDYEAVERVYNEVHERHKSMRDAERGLKAHDFASEPKTQKDIIAEALKTFHAGADVRDIRAYASQMFDVIISLNTITTNLQRLKGQGVAELYEGKWYWTLHNPQSNIRRVPNWKKAINARNETDELEVA